MDQHQHCQNVPWMTILYGCIILVLVICFVMIGKMNGA